jgi:hypothetical protein
MFYFEGELVGPEKCGLGSGLGFMLMARDFVGLGAYIVIF